MKFNYSLRKAASIALIPLLFFACNNNTEDPGTTPDPEPVIKTPVTLPDVTFETKLIQRGIDTDGEVNGQIWLEDVQDLTFLDLWSDDEEAKIEDLTGIEAFTSLTDLLVDNNALADIDLSANTALERLSLGNNFFVQIDLSQNTGLRRLVMHRNALTSIDLSANTALAYVNLMSNELTTIDIAHNTALENIVLNDNALTELLGIAEATSLKDLSLGFNQLTELSLQNASLEYLYLENNFLTHLDLTGSTALQYVIAKGNTLQTINTSDNAALLELKVGYNDITEIDISANTQLKVLWVTANELNKLDVSMLNDLYDLRTLHNNALTCIKISTDQDITTQKLSDYQNLSTTKCD